jgi:hypothetical protein
MEEDIKRWTARRKSVLVLEFIQGRTTVAETLDRSTYRLRKSKTEPCAHRHRFATLQHASRIIAD